MAAGAGIERLELIDGSTQGDISLSHNKRNLAQGKFRIVSLQPAFRILNLFNSAFESPGRRDLIKENASLQIFSSRAR